VSDGEKNHCSQCAHSDVSLGRKPWARRGGMVMVQDTQGKRWKRPQVNRIPARRARVLSRKHFSQACAGVMCVHVDAGV
jgi:hypothetical protein